jgi:putative membrane protein
MVTDHTGAGTKFKQAVAEAKLTAPAEELDAKHQALLDDLQKKDGTSFDTAYVKAQHDGHIETVAMFEAYAKGGDNARMKQFANDMLPTQTAVTATSERLSRFLTNAIPRPWRCHANPEQWDRTTTDTVRPRRRT